MDLARKIKRLRLKAELSQSELAAEAGAPLRSIQNWEQGHRTPRVDHLPRLAKALGVTVDELLK